MTAGEGPAPTRRGPRGLARYASSRVGWFVVGVAVALAAAAFVVPRDVAPGDTTSTALEHGQLLIFSGTDVSSAGVRQKLVDQWNAMHPDTPAKIKPLHGDTDAQHSQMLEDAHSDRPTADIYILDVTRVAEFASAGYIRPLTGSSGDLAGFLPNPLNTGRYQGKLWALPLNTDVGLLYYRTDIVGQSGPPRDVPLPPPDDYARRLASRDPGLSTPYVGQYDDYEGLTVNALEAIWSAGGDVVNARDQVVIDSSATSAGLQRLARSLPPDWSHYKEANSTTAFREGRTPLMRNWPVEYGNVDVGQKTPVRFRVSELPYRTGPDGEIGGSVLGGQDLAIAAGTTKPHAAQALLAFLTSEQSQQMLFRDGGFAAVRASVYADPGVRRQRPYADVVLTAVEHARPRPATPHYALFSSVFRVVVRYAFSHGGQLPSNARSALADALDGRRSG